MGWCWERGGWSRYGGDASSAPRPRRASPAAKGSRRWKLLLEAEHVGEEVALLLDALQHVGGFEGEKVGVIFAKGAVELVPFDGGGDGGAASRAEGVRTGGGLVAVVLAPVDEDLVGAQGLAHVRRHVGGV